MPERIPVLVVYAPTAAGKTSLVEKLFAQDADSAYAGKAEIISADSMQVYRELDIGTAKPDAGLLSRLPHHLISCVDMDHQFSTADFVNEADRLVRQIWEKGKIPVVCGGTAFYIRNFLYGLPPTPEADDEVRALMNERMLKEGAEKLYEELRKLDPESAAKIHVHDEYRIKRALEVVITTGKKRSSFTGNPELRQEFQFHPVCLTRERAELRERIDLRVEQMFADGLVEEFRHLLEKGAVSSYPGMQAIGYREFFMTAERHGGFMFDHAEWIDDVKAFIKTDTRHYAKKQETFFKSFRHGIAVSALNALDELTDLLDNDFKFH